MKFFIIVAISLLVLISCANRDDIETTVTPAITTPDISSSEKPQTSSQRYLEGVAENLGIIKDENGHLLIEGRASVRILRLLGYFNAEARAGSDDKKNVTYKISGFYGSSLSDGKYADNVGYSIQISSDDFSTPIDVLELAQESGLEPLGNGYLSANHENSYAALSAILAYRNAEAANDGRDYKLKAWYSTQESGDIVLSDSVDVIVQFSFDEKLYGSTPDLAQYANTLSAVERQQKSVIATIAVDFAQLLKGSGELNILSLDFSGDSEQGPSLVYLFDDYDIEILKDIREGRRDWSVTEILSLAEVKEPRLNFSSTGVFSDQPSSSQERVERSEEPIGQDAIKVVARIAVETARVINPTNMSIVVYEFEGASPTSLTTWSYRFDKEAIEILRNESLSPESTLRLASISEGVAIIPGDRKIPSFK